MARIRISSGKTVNIEDINLHLTCPGCDRSYNVSISKPAMNRDCRCGGGTWTIAIVPSRGWVNIMVGWRKVEHGIVWGSVKTVEPDYVEVEGEVIGSEKYE